MAAAPPPGGAPLAIAAGPVAGALVPAYLPAQAPLVGPIAPALNMAAAGPGANRTEYGRIFDVRGDIQGLLRLRVDWQLPLRNYPAEDVNWLQMIGFHWAAYENVAAAIPAGINMRVGQPVIWILELAVPIPVAINMPLPHNIAAALPIPLALRRGLEVGGHLGIKWGQIWNIAPPLIADNRHPSMVALDQFVDLGNNALDFPAAGAAGDNGLLCLQAIGNRLRAMNVRTFDNSLTRVILTGTLALVVRGEVTDAKLDRILTTLSDAHGIDLGVGAEDLKQIYINLHSVLSRYGIEVGTVLRNLSQVFTEEISIRVNVLISQTIGSGASGLNIALQAIKSFPTHEVWSFLAQMAPQELVAVVDAGRQLATNALGGYQGRNVTENFKSTLFPAVAYAAQQLLFKEGGKKSVRMYRGKFETVLKSQIDTIIQKVMDERTGDVNLEDFRGVNGVDWHVLFTDRALVYDALKITN